MKCGLPALLLLTFLALFLVSQATPTALRQADTDDSDDVLETITPATPVGEPEDDDDFTPTPTAVPGIPTVPESPVAPVPIVDPTPMDMVEPSPIGMVEPTPMMEVESTPMVDGMPSTPEPPIPMESPTPGTGPLPGPAAGDSCAEAERACVLGFAGTGGLQTFNLATTTPNVPFTPAVVSKDSTVSIGILNSNIEGEFIGDDGSVTLFSKAMVEGQSLSPSFFKMLTIDGRVSGVAHETPQVGQVAAVVGKCVRVFVTEWQVLEGGNVVDNVNGKTDKRENVCVVFRTIAA